MEIRNAFRAGAAHSLDELRDMVGSLEAQLATLYEEKEHGGWQASATPVPSSGGDVLLELYEQKARASANALVQLQETATSLEAQLVSLYAEKEASHEALAHVEGLEAQLAALYAEREDADGMGVDELRTIVDGLNAQLTSLYDERAALGGHSVDEAAAVIEGLEAQLHALYAEREDQALAADLGPSRVAEMAASLENFEAQLASLYDEQSRCKYGIGEANAMVDSLEAQVAALLEERNALAAQLESRTQDVEAIRAKAKDVVSAMLEKALG
jgi:chromosome segregation ATPase